MAPQGRRLIAQAGYREQTAGRWSAGGFICSTPDVPPSTANHLAGCGWQGGKEREPGSAKSRWSGNGAEAMSIRQSLILSASSHMHLDPTKNDF
jgi:hypothetical protein